MIEKVEGITDSHGIKEGSRTIKERVIGSIILTMVLSIKNSLEHTKMV